MSEDQRKFVAAILAGDPRAIKMVETWIYKVIKCSSWMRTFDWEDIRQEALLALVENLRHGNYRGEGLRSYVERITKNKCVNILRQQKREMIDPSVELENVEVPADCPDPGEKIDRERKMRLIRLSVQRLSPENRQLLKGAFVDGLLGREAAAQLGISHNNYRRRLHKCTLELRGFCEKGEKTP